MMKRMNILLTSREAAQLLRIGRTKLWELTRSGEIPAYRVGSGRTSPLRYKRQELLRWLTAHRVVRRPVAPGERAAGETRH